MGVTGLWTVVQPCARPIKIETLNKKRLAVDASIWIYQFLKAVRDKEGNALRNSHVVGFFRRICKLLFFGIKPVFVFDGGAPALKRQTISGRKARREGRREDAVRTAGKLLALQMQRRAEQEEEAARAARQRPGNGVDDGEAPIPEDLVYAEQIGMSEKERVQSKRFKRKDAYHLPDLGMSMAAMGGENDPRIMSLEELHEYARQFDAGEDINVYDFSKIDFDGPFFMSLPASDRYNILNAARLRSRLRMGYSKDQLDNMFPDRMAFSRFQIERVTERNELTQRLMNINGMADDSMFGVGQGARIAGEKGREYVLVRNDAAEGGWALGVVSNKEGQKDRPIDVDKEGQEENDGEDGSSDDEFEDIPIAGLNRLPERPPQSDFNKTVFKEIENRRKAIYDAKNKESARRDQVQVIPDEVEENDLFVQEDNAQDWEDVNLEEPSQRDANEDDDLSKAIAMSLEKDTGESFKKTSKKSKAPMDGWAVAREANRRSQKAATEIQIPFQDSDDEDGVDLQVVISQQQPASQPSQSNNLASQSNGQSSAQPKKGPLPFEAMDLGTSLLGKKKKQQIDESQAGGFEKDLGKDEKKAPKELPPWFAGELNDGLKAQKESEAADRRMLEQEITRKPEVEEPLRLRKQDPEIIDLDAEPNPSAPIFVDSDSESSVAASEFKDIDDLVAPATAESIHEESPKPIAPAVTRSEPKQVTKVDMRNDDMTVERNTVEADKVSEGSGELSWSRSQSPEAEKIEQGEATNAEPTKAAEQALSTVRSRSASEEFEDIAIPDAPEAQDVPEPNNHATKQTTQAMSEEPRIPDENPPDIDVLDEEDFSDPDELEMMRSLAIESEAHAEFAASLNPHRQARSSVEEYERELRQLRTQQKKDRRDADEVTQVMIQECQQLLKLFGLPYITAPMEAEAQCAELVTLGLVDGIVTDDSDIFLFGGTRVYKNMFNAAKFVECYLLSDLEKEFDLDRKKLIGIAHLLGSDYTEGLPGVGPVSALEILGEFTDLTAFKEWWAAVQNGSRPKAADAANAFRKKFRRNATKLFLAPTFPDARVEHAYLHPEVDSDPEQFQWGIPDLQALRAFLMATIGWNEERTDEVLVPVIKDMNRRMDEGTQSNITNFLGGSAGLGAFAPRQRKEMASKRMGVALERMAEKAKRKQKRAVEEARLTDADEARQDAAADGTEGSMDEDHEPIPKRRRRAKKA